MAREIDLGSVVGPRGESGKSAYDVWKEQPGNEGKSEVEYLEAMKGEKGEQGEKGDQGEVGPTGKTGLSAYEIWKSYAGNEGKTEEEFLTALKGAAGEKGETGPQGPKGEAFTIAKAYASIEEMNEGFAADGVKEGQFVVIETGDVNDEDNAKLYLKGTETYVFVTDLSGAQGLTGPQGPQGPVGETGEQGPAGEKGADGKTPSFRIDDDGHLYAIWEE